MSALHKFREALSDLVAELTPGGVARRATSGASPIAPLFFFCAFALLASMSLGVFSDNLRLQTAAFVLFAATLALSVGVYLYCLWRRPDLLRSEGFTLATRSDDVVKADRIPRREKNVEPVEKAENSETPS